MKNRLELFHCVVLTLMPAALFASDAAPKPPAESAATEQQSVKIALHPMAEPRPALKYRLLPPLLDRRPGNAAVRWNRLPAEQTQFLVEFGKLGGLWEKTEQWMAVPLGDPREKEFRAKEPAVNRLLDEKALFAEMDYAARFETCDWELPLREGRVFEMLLPEVQLTRAWGRMLAAKAHAEIADKKYDEAVRTLQTGFALARHVAQGQTLINSLVGTAIAGQMSRQLEELVQQPGAPNLYWALAELPRPLIDFRPAYEFEMNALVLHFTELQTVAKGSFSEKQWNEMLGRFVRDLAPFGNEPLGGRVETIGTLAHNFLPAYPRAKRYLIAGGRTKAEVEAMPIAQVVLLYTVDLYEEMRDEQFKAVSLPYPEAKAALERADAKLKLRAKEEIFPFASMMLPSLLTAKQAEARSQWIIARLRILEALRMYAAAHAGQLPERLSDIGEAPIPSNPFDDKPFTYHRDGNRATLGCESGPRNLPWRYEITMTPAP